jgi:hypothetical protein
MTLRQVRRDQVVHSAAATQGHEDRAERTKLWKSIHYWLRPNACSLQKPLTAVMSPASHFHRRSGDLISDSIVEHLIDVRRIARREYRRRSLRALPVSDSRDATCCRRFPANLRSCNARQPCAWQKENENFNHEDLIEPQQS